MPMKQTTDIKPSTLFLIAPSQQGQPSHCRGRARTWWCAARCSWKNRRRSSLSPPGSCSDDGDGDYGDDDDDDDDSDLIDLDDDWLKYLSEGVSNGHPKLDQSLPRPAPSLLDWDAQTRNKNKKETITFKTGKEIRKRPVERMHCIWTVSQMLQNATKQYLCWKPERLTLI